MRCYKDSHGIPNACIVERTLPHPLHALMVIPYIAYAAPFIRKVMLLSLGEKSRSLALENVA